MKLLRIKERRRKIRNWRVKYQQNEEKEKRNTFYRKVHNLPEFTWWLYTGSGCLKMQIESSKIHYLLKINVRKFLTYVQGLYFNV